MTEDEILEDMRRILLSDKNAGEPVGWSTGSGRDSLILTTPLEVLSPSVGTARLVLRAVRGSSDRNCSATLVVTIQGRDLRAWRMDWRPVHEHTNRCGPKELRGLVSQTGIHEFECNAGLGLARMQAEDLPLCIPLTDEPHNFDAFVRLVCAKLNIAPTEPVLSPPWSPTLF